MASNRPGTLDGLRHTGIFASSSFSENMMRQLTLLALASAFAFPVLLAAQDPIASAVTAGPATVSYVPVPGFPKGADMSVVYGDPAAGAFEMYFRLQPGVWVPMHFHTSAERAVGVQGVMTMEYEDGSTMTIGPGTYTFIPWKLPHAASCATEGSPCIAYFYFDKAFDVTWVKDPPADPNP